MSSFVRRAGSLVIATAAVAAGLLSAAPTAVAATTIEAAASAFGLGSYTVAEMPSSGDITASITKAARTPAGSATIVHLPAGKVTVSQTIRPADRVYLVAEPDATVLWRGSSGYLVRFDTVTSGIYGGTWDGSSRGSSVIGTSGASVQLAQLTITEGNNHGVGVYDKSTLVLQSVTTSRNKVDGVHLEDGSTLEARGLSSVLNRRNGVQLSTGSTGTIVDSHLDRNGQAVRGSTSGKTGHGLGLAAARATVTNTSMSDNKVCGVSLAKAAAVTISGSHLDRNGRHGLGTTPGTTATISTSTAISNHYDGILASGAGTRVALQGVTITYSKKIGLSVPTHGSATVAGSTISRSGTQNISVSGGGSLTLLDGNTITKARQHGIAVSERSSLTVSGAGNVVSENRKNGLLMTNAGTTGRISAAIAFQENHGFNGRVLSRAKLVTVPCTFTKVGKMSFTTGTGGKVTPLS